MSNVNIDEYKKQLETFMLDFDNRLGQQAIFQKIKEATGVRPAHVALAAIVFVALFALFGVGSHALCNLVGFVYPAYCSFKALKTPESEDDTQWLTYWVVYAFFVVVESLTDILLHWIPFYYLTKVVFLIWCFAPQTRGASRIYKHGIEPLLNKYEEHIDSVTSLVREGGKAVRDEYKDDAAKAASIAKRKVINAGVDAAMKDQ